MLVHILTRNDAQTGQPSGIFNTYAIPFRSVRVTVTLLSSADADTAHGVSTTPLDTERFWIILRGHTLLARGTGSSAPISFNLPGSGQSLPATARLKTRENVGVALKPGDYLELVRSTSTSGMVYMVTLQVSGHLYSVE